jgi:hypothetical protein
VRRIYQPLMIRTLLAHVRRASIRTNREFALAGFLKPHGHKGSARRTGAGACAVFDF